MVQTTTQRGQPGSLGALAPAARFTLMVDVVAGGCSKGHTSAKQKAEGWRKWKDGSTT